MVNISIRNLLSRFESRYGANESRLTSWQRLCEDCGLASGTSITQCKKILSTAHVNIIDLLDASARGVCPRRFETKRALAEYTLRQGKKFPLRLAKENGLLKVLLVKVF